MDVTFPDDLVLDEGGRIVLLVMDGLGGLPHPDSGLTELEAAATPNLDRLAAGASLGMSLPVDIGVTPGSGPGHLGLFGYDPVRYNIGRGVLSALGVGFDLRPGDVAVRLNLATLDADGNVADRRAGRPSDQENARLVGMLQEAVPRMRGAEVFFASEKEHRVVLILRGRELSPHLGDTDPQQTGVPPHRVEPLAKGAEDTAAILQDVLDAIRETLRDEPVANAVLARGIDAYEPYPGFPERFHLRARAIARYPMYRGVARLVGMEPVVVTDGEEATVAALEDGFTDYDFHFIHFKAMDSRGEDGDFAAKVAAIERVDALLPRVEALGPDVLVVTGDHSTPWSMKAHSWHPVPILIASACARPRRDAVFGEASCMVGELGTFPAAKIMSLALAHARRLSKFGA